MRYLAAMDFVLAPGRIAREGEVLENLDPRRVPELLHYGRIRELPEPAPPAAASAGPGGAAAPASPGGADPDPPAPAHPAADETADPDPADDDPADDDDDQSQPARRTSGRRRR